MPAALQNHGAPYLAQQLKKAVPGLVLVLVFSVAVNVLSFVTPLYLVQVLDRVVSRRSVETLWMLTVLAVTAMIAGTAVDAIRRRMLVHLGAWLDAEIAPRLAQQMLERNDLAGGDREDEGMQALAQLRAFIARSVAPLIDAAFVPVFLLAIALIHPLLGLICLIAIALLAGLFVVRSRAGNPRRDAARQSSRSASRLLRAARRFRESMLGLSMADPILDRWSDMAAIRRGERHRADGLNAGTGAVIRGLAGLLRIAMIAIGVWLFLLNATTLGGIFAARVMAGFCYRIVERAGRSWGRIPEAREAYHQLDAILARQPADIVSILPGIETAEVRVEGLSYRYPRTARTLLRQLSFVLAPGEMLLVTGAAETGKTTLVRLLVGLLSPGRGHVRLGAVDLSRLPLDRRAELVGYAPQHTELFDGSIRENISRFRDCRFEDVVRASEMAGVHQSILALPNGYDTLVHGEVFDMSGSKRKRIAIARALLCTPRLVVLDEPMANLDLPSRRCLESTLLALKAAGSTVVVTQSSESIRLARIADKVLDLNAKPLAVLAADDPCRPSVRRAALRRVK